MHALIITNMPHTADQFSSYVKEDKSMSKYLKRTKMDSLTVWATEIKIFTVTQTLRTSIFVDDVIEESISG